LARTRSIAPALQSESRPNDRSVLPVVAEVLVRAKRLRTGNALVEEVRPGGAGGGLRPPRNGCDDVESFDRYLVE